MFFALSPGERVRVRAKPNSEGREVVSRVIKKRGKGTSG